MATAPGLQEADDDLRDEKQVAPLELFFDLVYVFAVTQVSHLLLNDLSWAGAVHALLALGVVWWAWNYTVWVTSEIDLDPIPVRLLFLAMMFAGLVLAVAVPEAFGSYGPLFAGAYLAIKVGRLLFLTVADAPASPLGRGRETRLLAWFVASGVLWVAGALVEGDGRIVLWAAALAVDLAGPLVLYWIPGHPRLRFELWRVELLHLADRYETFAIIALGETIVLTGATVSALGFDDDRFAAFVLAFVSTAGLYWLYFDGLPRVARRRLEGEAGGVHLARDAYMYLHVVLVAGVILSAVGDGLVIERPTTVLSGAEVAIVCAGPALYLLGSVLFRARITGSVPWLRLAAAIACIVIGVLGSGLPALGLSILLVGVLATVIAFETIRGARAAAASGATPEPISRS